jgi:hypothetical protein
MGFPAPAQSTNLSLPGGVVNGASFSIPSGSKVWPVVQNDDGKLWPDTGVITHRSSEHHHYRKLPTTGSFRSFHDRNTAVNKSFAIALFNKPVWVKGRTIIGCITDFKLVIHDDLPF